MTITLICVFIFLFALAYEKSSKHIHSENEKRKNKTSPTLQAAIGKEILAKVQHEWETLNSLELTPDEKLLSLYKKFNIPTKEELKGTPLQDKLRTNSLDTLCRAITMREIKRLGYKYHYGTRISPSLREKLCNENSIKQKYPWL